MSLSVPWLTRCLAVRVGTPYCLPTPCNPVPALSSRLHHTFFSDNVAAARSHRVLNSAVTSATALTSDSHLLGQGFTISASRLRRSQTCPALLTRSNLPLHTKKQTQNRTTILHVSARASSVVRDIYLEMLYCAITHFCLPHHTWATQFQTVLAVTGPRYTKHS